MSKIIFYKKIIILSVSVLVIFTITGFFIFASLSEQHEDLKLQETTKKSRTAVEGVKTQTQPKPKQEIIQGQLHNSSNFEISFSDISNDYVVEQEIIYGFISPHHLLAKPVIDKIYSRVSAGLASQKRRVKQLVILSPNHFERGASQIITSKNSWQTRLGTVEADNEMISRLIELNFAADNYSVTEQEHGIFNHIPFIKKYFPQAKITPLIIKEQLTLEQSLQLADFLKDNLGDESLVMVSADFSHYLPENTALFHDQASISALANFDYEFVRNMDVDTPSSILCQMIYMNKKFAQQFVLVDNKISFDYFESNKSSDSTSYISGYYVYGPKQEEQAVSLLFLGDLMLDRYVFQKTLQSGDYNWPFDKFGLFLKGINYRIANLEGPVTDFKSRSIHDMSVVFTFNPNFLPYLKNDFEIFNLANNHIMNYGKSGLEQTYKYLQDNNIQYFGSVDNSNNLSTIIEKNGLKIALVGYHSLTGSNFEKVNAEVKKLDSKADQVIVYTHWGREYQSFDFLNIQQAQAHQLIDSGADIIIGSHPHVIQPLEQYKGKMIFYSLGNFIFDQFFSSQTQQGLGVGISIKKDNTGINTDYYLMPLKINKNCQAEVPEYEFSKKILENLGVSSEVNTKIKEQISNGMITIF